MITERNTVFYHSYPNKMENQQQQEQLIYEISSSKERLCDEFQWPEPYIEDFNSGDWPLLDESICDEDIEKWVIRKKRILLRTVTWNHAANPPPQNIDEVTKGLLPRNK